MFTFKFLFKKTTNRWPELARFQLKVLKFPLDYSNSISVLHSLRWPKTQI